MPGPKPLAPEAYAARGAKRLNYRLVAVVAGREFRVACLSCGTERTVAYKHGNLGPVCVCTHKRKFYRTKRTPETHTKELSDLGYRGYECLEINTSKSKNLYRHSCGNEFRMTKDCFVGSGEPCNKCRAPRYTHDDYVTAAGARGLEVLDRFSGMRLSLRHRFIKCGHVRRITPGRVAHRANEVICRTCKPCGVWYRGKAGGKRFLVRSKVEVAFLKALVRRGFDMDSVEYEPKSGRVPYFNPVKNRRRIYVPDFKVNDTYIELKDLASLGLKHYNWMDAEEALIENRAKCEAARAALGDYRIYMYHKGEFHLVHKFWTAQEQKRLLSL